MSSRVNGWLERSLARASRRSSSYVAALSAAISLTLSFEAPGGRSGNWYDTPRPCVPILASVYIRKRFPGKTACCIAVLIVPPLFCRYCYAQDQTDEHSDAVVGMSRSVCKLTISRTLCDAKRRTEDRFFGTTQVDEGRPLDLGSQRLAMELAGKDWIVAMELINDRRFHLPESNRSTGRRRVARLDRHRHFVVVSRACVFQQKHPSLHCTRRISPLDFCKNSLHCLGQQPKLRHLLFEIPDF